MRRNGRPKRYRQILKPTPRRQGRANRPPLGANLKNKMANSISTRIKFNSTREAMSTLVIARMDATGSARDVRSHPHSNGGRNLAKFSKTVADRALKKGRARPLQMVKNDGGLKRKKGYRARDCMRNLYRSSSENQFGHGWLRMFALNLTHPAAVTWFTYNFRSPIQSARAPVFGEFPVRISHREMLLSGKQVVHPIAPQVFACEFGFRGAKRTFSWHVDRSLLRWPRGETASDWVESPPCRLGGDAPLHPRSSWRVASNICSTAMPFALIREASQAPGSIQ